MFFSVERLSKRYTNLMEQATESTLTPEHQEHVERVQAAASKNASWATIIVLFVIMVMIITGAFYAWGKRVAEERALMEAVESQRY